jgi:flagellar motility protein MotE (MotC chaperone)
MTGISANTSAQGAQALGATNFYNPAAGQGSFAIADTSNIYAGAGQAVPPQQTLSTTGTEAEGTAQAPGQPRSFAGELKARVTDPSKLADMTLMATPQIIGSIYAQQAGKEQQEQIDKYNQELKALQGKDEAAYQLKLKESQEYIQNAKNINPSYWAQQSANQAQISGARGLAESYRDDRMAGLRSPSYYASERRRANIGMGQNVGTAYDRGYGVGLNLRDSSIQRGLGMIPNAPRTGIEGQAQLSNMYANLDSARASAGQGAAQMASYFTYPMLSQQTRDQYRRG